MNHARITDAPRSLIYRATAKGRVVLRSAAQWGLSRHLRDLLAMCDPHGVRVEDVRQFIPPESLQIALYALQELELIEGPPVAAPNLAATRAEDIGLVRPRRIAGAPA
jgi:hypothetical protein